MKLKKIEGGWEIIEDSGEKFLTISEGSRAVDIHKPGTHVGYFEAINLLAAQVLRLHEALGKTFLFEEKP